MNLRSNTTPKSPTPKRSFTLHQLKLEVSRRLLSADPAYFEGVRVGPPAMPTLKLWSKEGVFDSAHTLDRAAQAAIQRIKAAPGRFKVQPGTVIVAAAPPKDESHQETPRTSHFGDQISPGEATTLHATLAAMTVRLNNMQRINDIAYSAISRVLMLVESQRSMDRAGSVDHLGASVDSVPNEIVRAIDQLDGIRKHVLMSSEREKQLGQQQSAPVSRMNEGVSALDVQRILARISNVEQKTTQIVQLLEEKHKQ